MIILVAIFAVVAINIWIMLRVIQDRLFFVLQTVLFIIIIPGLFPDPGIAIGGLILGFIFISGNISQIPKKPKDTILIERFTQANKKLKDYPGSLKEIIEAIAVINVILISIAIIAGTIALGWHLDHRAP